MDDGRNISKLGVKCKATELYGQGYGECGIDFLTDFRNWDYKLNPPFKLSELFIKRCIEHGVPFVIFKKSNKHSSRRLKFDAHPPSAVLPLFGRPDFHFGKKEVSDNGLFMDSME